MNSFTYLMPDEEASEEVPNAKEEARHNPCYRKIWCGIYHHDPCMECSHQHIKR